VVFKSQKRGKVSYKNNMAQHCIICNKRNTLLYFEKNNSKNVFCGEKCQTAFYIRRESVEMLIGGPFTYLMDRPDFNAGTVTAMVQRMEHDDIARVMQDLLNDKSVDPDKKKKVLHWIANPLLSLSSGNSPRLGAFYRSVIKEEQKLEAYRADLLWASLYNKDDDMELAQWLIFKGGYDPSMVQNISLRRASERGVAGFVKLLLKDERVDPLAKYSDPFREVALFRSSDNTGLFEGNSEVLKLLLKDGRPNPTIENSYVLRYASVTGQVEMVKLLLQDRRADPTAIESEALRKSAYNGRTGVVKLLLQDGRADPSANNDEALESAVEKGYRVAAELLLHDERIDPEEYGGPGILKFGRLVTYLVDRPGFNRGIVTKMLRRMYASDAVQIMQDLITDPSLDPVNKEKALGWFARPGWSHKELEAYRARLVSKTDPSNQARLKNKKVPIWEFLETIEWLINNDDYDPGSNDNLPLRAAAGKGDHRLVKLLLLDKRVDPTAKDSEALKLAKAKGHFKVVELLRRDGRADMNATEY
jgi:ankyrin repeat protein